VAILHKGIQEIRRERENLVFPATGGFGSDGKELTDASVAIPPDHRSPAFWADLSFA